MGCLTDIITKTEEEALYFRKYGEMNLPNILNALEQNGHSEEQAWLAGKVEEKADILFAEAYPFASGDEH